MISQSKKQALQSLKKSKRIFAFSTIYVAVSLICKCIPFIFSIDFSIGMRLAGNCLATLFTYPILIGLFYCLINDEYTVESIFHFYYGKRVIVTAALTVITLITNNLIKLFELFIPNTSRYLKMIVVLTYVLFFIISTFIFVFEYYFVKTDRSVKSLLEKSFILFKNYFVKIVLFNFSFILWTLIPVIIVLIYAKVNAIDNFQQEIIMFFLPNIINIIYVPYYYKSSINYIQFLESREN